MTLIRQTSRLIPTKTKTKTNKPFATDGALLEHTLWAPYRHLNGCYLHRVNWRPIALKAAETDYLAGLKPNSSRHSGARPGSAWDTWYLRKYQELQNSK